MTEAEFARQLSELSTIAKNLNAESDSVNDLLTRFEEQVRAMNVGLEVSVGLYDVWDDDPDETVAWTKMRRKVDAYEYEDYWGLALSGKRVTAKPLLEGSREQRIAALDRLSDLIEALKKYAQARIDTIRKAKQLIGGEHKN